MFDLQEKLRSISVEEMQNAIAKALSDKIGIGVDCTINKIDYAAGRGFSLVKVEATFSEPFRSFPDYPSDDGQTESA